MVFAGFHRTRKRSWRHAGVTYVPHMPMFHHWIDRTCVSSLDRSIVESIARGDVVDVVGATLQGVFAYARFDQPIQRPNPCWKLSALYLQWQLLAMVMAMVRRMAIEMIGALAPLASWLCTRSRLTSAGGFRRSKSIMAGPSSRSPSQMRPCVCWWLARPRIGTVPVHPTTWMWSGGQKCARGATQPKTRWEPVGL